MLLLCGGLLVALNKVDRAGFERHQARAEKARAEVALREATRPPDPPPPMPERTARRAPAVVETQPRVEHLGGRQLILLSSRNAWGAGAGATGAGAVAGAAEREREREEAERENSGVPFVLEPEATGSRVLALAWLLIMLGTGLGMVAAGASMLVRGNGPRRPDRATPQSA